MAAYASLLSLMYVIEQIQQHPCPPISLDKTQVESLTEKITFLQDFLEVYNHHDRDYVLENRILDAAHAAEDVIEYRIVDQILHESKSHWENINSNYLFYQDLQKVLRDMDLVKKEVIEIKKKIEPVQDHLHKRSSMPEAAASRSSPSITMGFDDVLIQLMDKLTIQHSSGRQIIPIVGMAGIGKTTLARHVYEHPFIVERFDVRAWATISQEYNAGEILSRLVFGQGRQESSSQMSERVLGEMLYKSLFGRRYLIIMDDMWSIEAWEELKFSFPNENNGSGIIITSRISNVAEQLTGGHGLEMNFLNKDVSWSLVCKIVFGEGGCPFELEATGKKIAENCKGLPLSLVVIGGLLAKSNGTREYWEYIAENLNSIVNLENDADCLNLLYLSYNHLPVHLKPCFLYFGAFSEDHEILVRDLVNLWVAEGFLKPISGKSWEEVAEEYFKEILDRNLILVSDWDLDGKVRYCKIHDLLRDLCLREAEKEKFLCVTRQHSHNTFPHGLNTQRRIAFHYTTSAAESLDASNARSLIFNSGGELPSLNSKLARVLLADCLSDSLQASFFPRLVNLRLVSTMPLTSTHSGRPRVPSSFYLLWNLHTLDLQGDLELILDIWQMPSLRHVNIRRCYLSKAVHDRMHGQGDFILENLHFLSKVVNFRCSEETVKSIPNIKILKLNYEKERFIGSHYCLNNLVHLEKLEELECDFWPEVGPINRNELLQNLTFPHSLKKLLLRNSRLHWEDISAKIGSLPHLQVLRLHPDSFVGPKWETSEGEFCSLKLLQIWGCDDLERWKTDNTHFPHLERLALVGLHKLKKIPKSIGDITTLQLIRISGCSDSVIFSAEKILKEQEEAGNKDLQVHVVIYGDSEDVESLASHNFSVEVSYSSSDPRESSRF